MNHNDTRLKDYSDDEIHEALNSFIVKWERKNARLGRDERISR